MSAQLESIIDKVRQHPKLIIAEDFEVAVQQIRSTHRRYYNGEAVHSGEEDKVWISLRILHRRQPGRAVVGFSTKESIHGLVESAFEASRRSSPDPWFRFPIWKRPRTESETPAMLLSEPVEYPSLMEEVSDAPDIFEENYDVSSVETQLFRKTERFPLSSVKQIHGMQLSLLCRSGERFFRMREERGHSRPLGERKEWLDALLQQASALKKGGEGTLSGELPGLFSPAVSSALLKRIASWFYADLVQSGRSPLPLVKGDGPLSSRLTLIDDGAFPGALQTAAFDLEGSLTQETCLIDKGRMNELLYDTYSATRENRISTANFMRPAAAMTPRIGVSNLYLKPSSSSPGDLLKMMRSGVYLQSVTSLEQVPGTEHQFQLQGSGWRIEDEECVHPVWDLSVRFDVSDLFRRIAEVGSDLTFYGAYGSPSVLFDKVTVL